LSLIVGTSHGINLEDMDVAALLKEDTDDDAFGPKVCIRSNLLNNLLLKGLTPFE